MNFISRVVIGLTFVFSGNQSFAQFPSKTFGQSGTDRGVGITETSDGDGYIIVGFTTSFGASGEDIYVVKTDLDGKLIWEKTFGGKNDDNAWSIKMAHDNNYIIVGFTNSYSSAGDWDIFTMKIDDDGNEVDMVTYESPGDQLGWDILPTSDGSYLISGQTTNNPEDRVSSECLKVSGTGSLLWRYKPNLNSVNRVFSAIQLDDTYYLTGLIENEDDKDGILINLTEEGEENWIKEYGSNEDDILHYINLSEDRNILLSGYSKSFTGDKNSPWMIKINSDGEEIWTNSFGSLLEERIVCAAIGKNGGITLLGYVFKETDVDILLIQADPKGQLVKMDTFGSDQNDESGQTMIINDKNQIVFSGRSYGKDQMKGDLYLMIYHH